VGKYNYFYCKIKSFNYIKVIVTSNVHLFVFLSILACYSASGLLENKSFRSEDIALQRNMFRKPTFDVIVSDALLCFRHSYSQARVIKFLLFDLTVCFISTLVKHYIFQNFALCANVTSGSNHHGNHYFIQHDFYSLNIGGYLCSKF